MIYQLHWPGKMGYLTEYYMGAFDLPSTRYRCHSAQSGIVLVEYRVDQTRRSMLRFQMVAHHLIVCISGGI